MALLERFAYFLVSRRLDFDTDELLDTVTLHRAPRLLRRAAPPLERRRNAVLDARAVASGATRVER